MFAERAFYCFETFDVTIVSAKGEECAKNFKILLLFYFFDGNNFTGKAFDFG